MADSWRLRWRCGGPHGDFTDWQSNAVRTRTMATAGTTVPARGCVVIAVVGDRVRAFVRLHTRGCAGQGNAAQPVGDATRRQCSFAQHHQSKQPDTRREATAKA